MTERFANDAETTLASAVGVSDLSITVDDYSAFPTDPQFRILIDDELLLVTAGAGTATWTVQRGIEGTVAAAHSAGAKVVQVLTAGVLSSLVASSDDALHAATQGELAALTEKTSLANGDVLLIEDSEASYTKKKVQLSNLPFAGRVYYLNFVIDGGGSAITTGEKGHVQVPAGTIQAWTLLADQSGSIKIDIWRDSYANFPPTDADSLCGGHEPEIASAVKGQDTDLSDWTSTTLNEGDILAFNVDSASTVTRVTLSLKVQR